VDVFLAGGTVRNKKAKNKSTLLFVSHGLKEMFLKSQIQHGWIGGVVK
jgi:hypothetical protein